MPTRQEQRTQKVRAISDELLGKIGTRIRWLRECVGHTQSDWARALRISNQQLNKWEAGTRLPNMDVLVRIVTSTGASFDYIFLGRLTSQMNPELVRRLYARHGTELELRTDSVPQPPKSAAPLDGALPQHTRSDGTHNRSRT